MKRGQGTAANPFRQHKGLSRRPLGLRAGPAAGAVRSLRPGDSLTPAFWGGRLPSELPPARTSQAGETARPRSPKGLGPRPPGFGPVAPRPLDARGSLGGRLPCAFRGASPALNPLSPQWLPFSARPPSRAGVATLARSSPSSLGQPSVRQSAPNPVHTRRLPAPAGSSSRAGQEV